jgi:hypothetical protein
MPWWQNFKSAFLVEFEWSLSQYESTTGVVGIQNLGDSAMYFFTQEILIIKSKLLTFVFESTELINTNKTIANYENGRNDSIQGKGQHSV